MNFTGQNVGAKLFNRVTQVNWICLAYVTLTGWIMSALLFGFARPLLSIYITDSLEAIEYVVLHMSYICLTYSLCGVMDAITGSLRSLGYASIPMFVSLGRVVILRIIWLMTIFRIPKFHNLDIVYVSYPISWIATISVELALYFVAVRRVAAHARK